jgi:cysteine desulfurase / selenocysteine lyase
MNDFIKDFPILQNRDYIYFDNAATTQRPIQVMEAINNFYKTENANPLRGLYEWSVKATEAYENAREKTAKFIGAGNPCEIVFTRNATESLNLIAYSWGLSNINEGDEIVIAVSEHHSNILPWQMVAKQKNAKIVWLETEKDGSISEEELKKINSKTKLVAVAEVSNVLGMPKPIKHIAELAHKNGAVIVVDGAQAAPHTKVNVTDLDADFFVFSGHKLLAPMGIGVLYGKKELLQNMPPFLTGGEMIEYVTRENATFAELPHKFEAGTVNAAGAVGLGAAIDYISNVGFDFIENQEKKLSAVLMEEMSKIPHIEIYGSKNPEVHCGIVTFNVEGCHPHDVASVLDADHICVRAGHHCAQPLMKAMGVPMGSTCRASMYFYNTEDEVYRFVKYLSKVREEMGYGS